MSLTERATAKISGVCPRYPLPERQWARRLERPLQQRSRTHFGYDCRFAITEVMFFIFAVENSKPDRIFSTACSPSGRTECRFFESATQF